MSGLISTAGLWSADKAIALTGYTPHQHIPSPIEPNFTAPERVSFLTFGPIALAAAVARVATTRDDAPVAVLDALQRSTLPMLETMVEDGTTFGLSTDFQYLGDTERTFLAARIGGGITDLYMNALGYTWRANAACLSSALDPHADFIYEGGNASGYGVVLAEAHGSFAANASAQSVHLQSKNKYLRQVKPYLAATSPYGKVIHGYSIAFGSAPSAPGAFLSLSETKIIKPKTPKRLPPALPEPEIPRDGATPTLIALAAHRSNFFLMGGDEVVGWIDWVRTVDGAPPEPVPVEFLRIQYAGSRYLVHPSSLWWLDPPRERFEELFDYRHPWHPILRWPPRRGAGGRPHLGWFAIEETAGADFLKSLTSIIQDGGRTIPATLSLPSFVPVGFGLGGDGVGRGRDDAGYRYALFRDGFALLGEPYRGRPRGIMVWSPKDGVSSP
ncbi:MAG: hypothetical protein QM576_09755 [Rhodopseudomonas sp.]|uniref:hypothetical protein n=1 Tax=Rhodopseudomonas sp. TaxID=1078 RepID=UPI0039E27224